VGAKVANSDPDALIARVAARQHGVVSLTQLAAAGIHRRGVGRRAHAGRLHRIHRGVYAVGHPGLSQEGKWMAAVLAFGAGAVISHRSAAALWRMLPIPSLIEVTVPGDAGLAKRSGIILHRSTTLLPSHTTRQAAIPVTKPARTLMDLRRVVPSERFAAALRQAEYRRLPISNHFDTDHTRSELEARFLGLCRRNRLPVPAVNVRVGRFVVDFLWRAERLIVETDGYRSHGSYQAFEDDRARELELELLGFRVRRFTWAQVTREGALVVKALRTALRC
jgi:very-short-patch-repair endonuclease